MNTTQPYIEIGKKLLSEGIQTEDRTDVGTYSLFGYNIRFDVSKYAPFITERKIPLRSVIGELLWFIEGSVNTDVLLNDYRCSFWNEWASDATRTIGPMYGKQWRDCNGVDQLALMLKTAITKPTSRRMLVNVWVPELVPGDDAPPKFNPENGLMSLAPCHFSYQLKIYNIRSDFRIVNLQFNLRSSDYFLGLPNNIASYYILQRLICSYLTRKTGIRHSPKDLIATCGDIHVYNNHVDVCNELFSRESSPIQPSFKMSEEIIDIFESYIDGSFNEIEDKPKARRSFVNLMYRAIEDYHPGAVIEGARNV